MPYKELHLLAQTTQRNKHQSNLGPAIWAQSLPTYTTYKKQLYSFLFFIPVYNYKVRTNLPQSTTQLHANIQLDSLVTSWPSSYVLLLNHAALKSQPVTHPSLETLDSTPMGDLNEGPSTPRWSMLVQLGYVLFNLYDGNHVLYQPVPHFPFYVLLLYLSVSSNRCCSCNWWLNHRAEGPMAIHHLQNLCSSNSLRRRQHGNAKMAYNNFPLVSPTLYLPCYVRNAPCGTRILL